MYTNLVCFYLLVGSIKYLNFVSIDVWSPDNSDISMNFDSSTNRISIKRVVEKMNRILNEKYFIQITGTILINVTY